MLGNFKYPITVVSDGMNDIMSVVDNKRFNIVDDDDIFITKDRSMPIVLSRRNNNVVLSGTDLVIHAEHKTKSPMLLNLLSAGLPVPNFILFCANIPNRILLAMDKTKRYMVKPEYGARSIGMAIVTYSELVDMLMDIQMFKIDKAKFNTKYDVKTGNLCDKDENEVYKLYNALEDSMFHLQEVVDFTEEYRVIYTYGSHVSDWVIEKRYGYRCDSTVDRHHTVVSNDGWSVLPQHVLERLKEFGDKSRAPWLSFDIYVTKRSVTSPSQDIEWGVFEYDTMFGIQYPQNTHLKLEKMMSDGLEHRIYDLVTSYPNIKFNIEPKELLKNDGVLPPTFWEIGREPDIITTTSDSPVSDLISKLTLPKTWDRKSLVMETEINDNVVKEYSPTFPTRIFIDSVVYDPQKVENNGICYYGVEYEKGSISTGFLLSSLANLLLPYTLDGDNISKLLMLEEKVTDFRNEIYPIIASTDHMDSPVTFISKIDLRPTKKESPVDFITIDATKQQVNGETKYTLTFNLEHNPNEIYHNIAKITQIEL